MPKRCADARLLGAVAKRDRAWFADNSGAWQYARPLVPGEFGPDPEANRADLTLVIQLAPGVRVRRPFIHVKRGTSNLVTIFDPARGLVYSDVPLIGTDSGVSDG